MKVLIACEESQTICKSFRQRGHEAYSNDIQDCSGGYPEWHLKCDVRDLLKEYFDLVIFHPVCKFISNSGVQHLHLQEGRWNSLKEACCFFNLRHKFNAPMVATENPIPHKYAVYGYRPNPAEKWTGIGIYDQLIQPWDFGHKQMKATCFWLKNLPPLRATNTVGPPPKDKKERYKWQETWTCSPGPDREKIRSKTYQGIADAIADQYGNPNNLHTQAILF